MGTVIGGMATVESGGVGNGGDVTFVSGFGILGMRAIVMAERARASLLALSG